MTPEDIEGRDDLAAWLEALPSGTEAERDRVQRLAVALAHRSAMRVLPIAVETDSAAQSPYRHLEVITVFRQNLIAGVAAACPSPEIRSAAAAVFAAAPASTRSSPTAPSYAVRTAAEALSTAASASVTDSIGHAVAAAHWASAAIASHAYGPEGTYGSAAAHSADAAEAETWADIRADCVTWDAGRSLESMPLWPKETGIHSHWAEVREALLAKGPVWAFWVDWYDRALAGEPQDWGGLLAEVALIPPEEWDKGADHVKARIADLIAKREIRPPVPSASTVRVIQSALAANAAAMPFQLAGLLDLLDEECERVRCDNRLDPDEKERLQSVFGRIRAAAIGMFEALPESGAPNEAIAKEIGSWATVLKDSAVHWNTEAKKIALGRDADKRVLLTARIALGGAVAGILTSVGLPNYAAVAGGAIVFGDGIKNIKQALESRISSGG